MISADSCIYGGECSCSAVHRSAAAIAHVLASRSGAGQAGDRGCALGLGPPVNGAEETPFVQCLLAFLESDQPLWSCTYCLGSVGRVFPHAQLPRREWRAGQSRPTEELVDWTHLELLESNPGMKVLDASYLPAPVE